MMRVAADEWWCLHRKFTVYAYHPNTNLSTATATDSFEILTLQLTLVSSAITYPVGVPLPQLSILPGGARLPTCLCSLVDVPLSMDGMHCHSLRVRAPAQVHKSTQPWPRSPTEVFRP